MYFLRCRGAWVAFAAIGILGFGTSSRGAQADDVVAAGGGVSVAGGVSLSFTVGEAVVESSGSGSAVVTAGFQQPSSYDYWSTAHGLTLGPKVDSDGDVLPNLLEYAYGTDPLASLSKASAQGSLGPGGKLYITMAKGTSAGDLLWNAEVSTDLVTWSSAGVSVALNDANTFSALYTGSAPIAFMRLRLDLLRSN